MTMYNFKVAAINEREVTTKFGPKKAYDLIAEDGTKYGFAFSAPARSGISVGSVVSCSGTVDRFGVKLDPKTVSVGGVLDATSSLTPTPAAKPTQAYQSGAKVFPLPKTHGDMAIIRQNSLTNAVATVADFIATQPTDKWPDLETWTDMVITTAYKYAGFSSGQREVEAVAKAMSVGMQAREIATAVAAHTGSDEEDEEAA